MKKHFITYQNGDVTHLTFDGDSSVIPSGDYTYLNGLRYVHILGQMDIFDHVCDNVSKLLPNEKVDPYLSTPQLIELYRVDAECSIYILDLGCALAVRRSEDTAYSNYQYGIELPYPVTLDDIDKAIAAIIKYDKVPSACDISVALAFQPSVRSYVTPFDGVDCCVFPFVGEKYETLFFSCFGDGFRVRVMEENAQTPVLDLTAPSLPELAADLSTKLKLTSVAKYTKRRRDKKHSEYLSLMSAPMNPDAACIDHEVVQSITNSLGYSGYVAHVRVFGNPAVVLPKATDDDFNIVFVSKEGGLWDALVYEGDSVANAVRTGSIFRRSIGTDIIAACDYILANVSIASE